VGPPQGTSRSCAGVRGERRPPICESGKQSALRLARSPWADKCPPGRFTLAVRGTCPGGRTPGEVYKDDHQLYVRTLSEFTRILLTPYEVPTMLSELADRVTDVLDLAGSGVSLSRGDRLEFDTAYGHQVAELERVQEQLQRGPCIEAFRTGKVVAVPDLSARSDQWPDYCSAAAAVGVGAVASIPMPLGEQTVGALNLYANGTRDWPDEDLEAARVMADMATGYLINASRQQAQLQLTGQLQHALNTRVVVEQAKGMVAERKGIPPEEAYAIIRQHARSHSATVHGVAQAIVDLGLEV
jgi:GAF domain-containing protein